MFIVCAVIVNAQSDHVGVHDAASLLQMVYEHSRRAVRFVRNVREVTDQALPGPGWRVSHRRWTTDCGTRRPAVDRTGARLSRPTAKHGGGAATVPAGAAEGARAPGASPKTRVVRCGVDGRVVAWVMRLSTGRRSSEGDIAAGRDGRGGGVAVYTPAGVVRVLL